MEGKGHVNSENLKRILNDNGYNLRDKDIQNLMSLANPDNKG